MTKTSPRSNSNDFSEITDYFDSLGDSNTSGDASVQNLSELWSNTAKRLAVPQSELAKILADDFNLTLVQKIDNIDSTLVSKIPIHFALKYLVIPTYSDNQQVTFVTADPLYKELPSLLEFGVNKKVKLQVATPEVLELAINQCYSKNARKELQALGKLWLDADGKLVSLNAVESKEIPTLARNIIVKAASNNVSDIHFQPFAGTYIVRFRIDGILIRSLSLPSIVAEDIVRYFKSKSSMDPTLDLIPQDGQMSVVMGSKKVNLRISVLPVKEGQRMVIRFLDQGKVYHLEKLGLSTTNLQQLRGLLTNNSGMILVTGPTGSGKTTSLYSLLSEINREDICIITVENPVEYDIPGISQVEVNHKSGLTFASALRSILRQDPEVVLIGEIRDQETAQIAMQAALTGHLVFATLHTNDALTTIPRLTDLGASPAMLSDSLVGVISQRLIRKLCEHCKQPSEPNTPRLDETMFQKATHIFPSYRAKGCEKCRFTGYQGRLPIMEILEPNASLKELIAQGCSELSELHHCIEQEMLPIAISAAKHVISGDCDVYEATRIIGRHFWHDCALFYRGETPSMSEISRLADQDDNAHVSILLVTEKENFDERLIQELENAWLEVLQANSPVMVKSQLQENQNICLVIYNLPDNLSDDELIPLINEHRIQAAWSLLPAILLLPDNRPELEQRLRETGTTSICLPKKTPHHELLETIQSLA